MFNLPTSKKTTEKKPSELITEFANPWLQQTQVLKKYEDEFLNNPNVAIEMPTGTGKTLVGLTIAHYKQNAERLKVVYLCPNKQLARQVQKEARKNNINTCLITNSKPLKKIFLLLILISIIKQNQLLLPHIRACLIQIQKRKTQM